VRKSTRDPSNPAGSRQTSKTTPNAAIKPMLP
jgi:hypothetical protein